MPYPAIIILALFAAITVAGAIGGWKHFAAKLRRR